MRSNLITDAFINDLADAVVERVCVRLKGDLGRVEQIVMDAEQTGIMIGRTKRAVMQMYYNGQLPGFKIGGKIAFDKRKILAWLEDLQVQ